MRKAETSPAYPLMDHGPSPLAGPEGGETAAAHRDAAKVLIVEDDYFVALELEHYLADAGFKVVGIAATAEEAVELAAAETPRLVIMDIRLAGARDGVDAAIEIYTTLGVPSVFASAHADPATRRRAQPAMPLGWLEKPYSSAAVIALVNQALADG